MWSIQPSHQTCAPREAQQSRCNHRSSQLPSRIHSRCTSRLRRLHSRRSYTPIHLCNHPLLGYRKRRHRQCPHHCLRTRRKHRVLGKMYWPDHHSCMHLCRCSCPIGRRCRRRPNRSSSCHRSPRMALGKHIAIGRCTALHHRSYTPRHPNSRGSFRSHMNRH